jgi:adenylate cyclase
MLLGASMKGRFTLMQVFVAGQLLLASMLAGFVALLVDRSQKTILASSEPLERAAAMRAGNTVEEYLGRAEKSVADLDGLFGARACNSDSAAAIDPCLAAQLHANEALAEISFTHATPSWQLSIFRESSGSLCRRYTASDGKSFTAEIRCDGREMRREPATDPTQHPTFTTPASPEFARRSLWSDLSWAERDLALPPAERRVVVTVLRALTDGKNLLGVVRVAERAEQLDQKIAGTRVNEDDPADPYRVLLSDERGRLITRSAPGDRLTEIEGDLRVQPAALPPAIAAALADPKLRALSDDDPAGAVHLSVDGRDWFASYRALPHTQDWRVVVVGPADYYLSELRDARRTLIMACAALLLLFLVAGAWAMRAIRAGLRRIAEETGRMRGLQFSPSEPRAPFRDVHAVLDSLEHAKTALRALGRYVPIDLVRQLYEDNRDPSLGGELRALTLMFTDIKGFTTLSETLPPDRLAQLLGAYLEAMTGAVEKAGGTVDKYIGDAVMAMWNAPVPREGHALAGCRAALACVAATDELFKSAAWGGMEPLVTRFGIHTAEVMVGHFGSPARLSYTAIGDGVNLAARLEGLNKQYGTTILVSDTVAKAAGSALELRRIDRVAVKGKSQAIEVHELIAEKGAASPARLATARAYEAAFEKYLARDFQGAIAALEKLDGDLPSERLIQRCRALVEDPPGDAWDGVYAAKEK